MSLSGQLSEVGSCEIAGRDGWMRERRASASFDPGSAALNAAAARNRELVERSEELVLASLPRRLTDAALARQIGVSIGDLRRAFLDVRRTTMYRALYQRRLEAVRQILEQDPERSPEAVAFECGFGHYGVFHRRYRRFLAERSEAAPETPPADPPGSHTA